MKFQGGADDQRGTLRRRKVDVWAVIPIGKEADNLEEREVLGDDDDAVEWALANHDRTKLLAGIEDVLKSCGLSDTELWRRAGVSHHTLKALRQGKRVTALALLNLARAAEILRQDAEAGKADGERRLQAARDMADKLGSVAKLASQIGVTRQYLGRVLRGEKPLTREVADRLSKLMVSSAVAASQREA